MITGIGGFSTADMVAYLTVQSAAEDKKSSDAMRASEEQVQDAEEHAQLESMDKAALEGLVGGLASATTKAVGAGYGLSHADQVATKVGEAKHADIARLFDAAGTINDATTKAMVGFEEKNVEQHKIAAAHARDAAEKLADDAKQAQGRADAGIQTAQQVRTTEDQTLLLTCKMG